MVRVWFAKTLADFEINAIALLQFFISYCRSLGYR
jgi:hypothetical protein